MAKTRSYFDSFQGEIEDEQGSTTPIESRVAVEDNEPEVADLTENGSKEPEVVEKKETKKETPKQEEVEQNEEGSDDDFSYRATIESIAEKTGLPIELPEDFEETDEAFADAMVKGAEKKFLDTLSPEVRKLVEIGMKGGDPEEAFYKFQAVDYSKVDISDEDVQDSLIIDSMRLQGFEDEDIKEKLEGLNATMKAKEAKVAQKYMVKHNEKEQANYEASLEQERIQAEKDEREALLSLKADIMELEDLGGFNISKKDKEDLFKHITAPVGKTGKTQLELNYSKKENQLLAAYFNMKGFKFADLEKKAVTKATSGLVKNLGNFGKKGTAGKTIAASTETNKVPRGPWNQHRQIED